MPRFIVRAAQLAIFGLTIGAIPAAAQFGGIFGDPPRPPANVPSRPAGRVQPLPQPPSAPQQPPSIESEAPPAGSLPAIQSQPLPPPPGAASEAPVQPTGPAQAPLGQPPLHGLPPGQRQPRGTPQPANTAPQPGDEVVTELPSQKIINPTGVFSGLDKITGRITSFDVAINETVQFGALQVTPRVCYTRPPTETPNTDAFVEVDEVTLQGEVKRIFTGWMFAASPGLHGVEHSIYDVWLIDCKGGSSTVAESQPVAPSAQAPRSAASPSRTTPQRQAPRQPALLPPPR